MDPKAVERKLNELQESFDKHQKEFKEQTRIDSVDVIVRRKDKNLEPIESPKKNLAQARVNATIETKKKKNAYSMLTKKNFALVQKQISEQKQMQEQEEPSEVQRQFEENLRYIR